MPEDYAQHDSELPASRRSYVGEADQISAGLWMHGGIPFQPTGDPMADRVHQAVRALVGLDNPADVAPDVRPTMVVLGGGGSPPSSGLFGEQINRGNAPARPSVLRGGQIEKVLGPRVVQSGSWSEPYFEADAGQKGNALQGLQSIRDRWSSKAGGVYDVDPKIMGMEGGIDIGQQIQDSIDRGGHMRGVLDQALKSGQAVPFDSGEWGLRRFNNGLASADGLTVGRWGGFVQGSLSARPDGVWTVDAGVWPQKPGQYDLNELDASGEGARKYVGNAAIGADKFVSGDGAPFYMNFNRIYNFRALGRHNSLGTSK
jgi:hypothetical protein